MNSRKCDFCNVDVHRASYAKHLRSKNHSENIKRNEMIIPEWLVEESFEDKFKKIYNLKSLKQLARDNIKLDDKQLNKGIVKKMINPYYFTDRALRNGFNFTLENHHINHANSKLTITPNFPEFGIETRYKNKIMKELSVIYAIILSQYKFKYQTVFSARLHKQDEDNRVLDETELFINSNINHNLIQTDIDDIDVKSLLEHQIQQQEMKDSAWRFDKINSITIYFL